MRAIAVIAAGGSGERLGAETPKALVFCAGRPLLEWSLGNALRAGRVCGAVVAAHGDKLDEFERIAAELSAACGKPVQVVRGGVSRSHSVKAAVGAADTLGIEFDAYAVHDAARPLAASELFDECIDGLTDADCVVAAAPATDTIKVAAADGIVVETPNRATLWAVQTPQVFRRDCLERALNVSDEQLAAASDDAALAEAAGARVRLLHWRAPNPKVTTPADAELAGSLLAAG